MSLQLNLENAIDNVSTGLRAPLADFAFNNSFSSFGLKKTEANSIVLSNAALSCSCGTCRRTISMRTTTNQEPWGFPVTVYDVNLVAIGVANNKAEYLTIWNSSVDNQAVGVLAGAAYPFSFVLLVCSPNPNYVYGDPIVNSQGIITEDGFQILTEDNQPIIQE